MIPIIRKARPEDFLAIAELDRIVWLDVPNGEHIADGEHTWRLWIEDAIVYCGVRQSQIVGAGLLFPSNAGHYWLHKIFVAEGARKAGVGTRLLEQLFAALDERKAPCYLTVRPENVPALKLYKQWGFVEDGFHKGFYRPEEDRFVLKRPAQ